jgi:hypothetical protein
VAPIHSGCTRLSVSRCSEGSYPHSDTATVYYLLNRQPSLTALDFAESTHYGTAEYRPVSAVSLVPCHWPPRPSVDSCAKVTLPLGPPVGQLVTRSVSQPWPLRPLRMQLPSSSIHYILCASTLHILTAAF